MDGVLTGDTIASARPEDADKQKSAADKQQALDRQLESWNAFHAQHGLLSDEFSML